MTKFLNFFMMAFVAVIALSFTGCNLPDGDDDDDEPDYPGYTYVGGSANHLSGQHWMITIDYQCGQEPLEVGVIVMREDSEVRRAVAPKKGSAYAPEGSYELDFTWKEGEQGCRVVSFISTSPDGVTTGNEISMPFGIVINNMEINNAGNGVFDITLNYFCDCSINEGKLTVYDKDNNVVMENGSYLNGFGPAQNSDIQIDAFGNGLLPKTEYRAVVSFTTEYNSVTSEDFFTTPSREPYQGDNNPPAV